MAKPVYEKSRAALSRDRIVTSEVIAIKKLRLYFSSSIRRKLALLLIVLTSVPIIIVSVLAYQNSAKSIENEVMNSNLVLMNIAGENLEAQLIQLEDIMISNFYDNRFIRSLNQMSSPDLSVRYEAQQYLNQKLYSLYLASINTVKGIQLHIRSNEKTIVAKDYNISMIDHPPETWDFATTDSSAVTIEPDPDRSVYYLRKPIRNFIDQELLGGITLEVREIARAGLSYFPEIDHDAPSPYFRMFAEKMTACGGFKDRTFDLARTEIVSEQLAKQFGISLLYNARLWPSFSEPAADTAGDHARTVVWKGKKGFLNADRVIAPPQQQQPAEYAIWTLTWANARIDSLTTSSLTAGNRELRIRTRPGFHNGTAVIDIAFPIMSNSALPQELIFHSQLEDIAASARRQIGGLEHAYLIMAGNEPFTSPLIQPQHLWDSVNKALWDLFHGLS